MYADPPPPRAKGRNESPPPSPDGLDGVQHPWKFNPDYQKLVEAWDEVLPRLETLRTTLDKAYSLARSPQTWDAPVGERYVEDIREWRRRLALYRHSVLTSISDAAEDTPRWVRTTDVPQPFW
ncbi:hypothetical protein [Nonomuraea gerenzanensis]|uniref:Uncharacterized protein n=1 Tax=Nonomuraea gerenzanensis TaxID=93944 RepID=A0A1M4E263_9ACTN|nr:hypothetical protein [Nonomuraea gerenzanensis]UBU15130.1 hypothetical protein LCN96_08930 [Nonomuraea gerenzanensis]SBO92873.1 hypothetical protein BN4615_P2387 [Nonomuraea gerenzanensis]